MKKPHSRNPSSTSSTRTMEIAAFLEIHSWKKRQRLISSSWHKMVTNVPPSSQQTQTRSNLIYFYLRLCCCCVFSIETNVFQCVFFSSFIFMFTMLVILSLWISIIFVIFGQLSKHDLLSPADTFADHPLTILKRKNKWRHVRDALEPRSRGSRE